MPLKDLPVFCQYDKQRFTQFGSMDCANWYAVANQYAKKKQALYPALGRRHVQYNNNNRLQFNEQPKAIYKTIDYFYVFVGTQIFRFDRFYNQVNVTASTNISLGGNIWFDFLAIGSEDASVVALFSDEREFYLITEKPNGTVTLEQITDTNRPNNGSNLIPKFVASFGNRFVVSLDGKPDFYLTKLNASGGASGLFTIENAPLQARASGRIGQFAVLNNQLYIFCDFTTDIWFNTPTRLTVAGITEEFPWKKNTSYNWDYGIADPFSLDVNFDRIAWLGQNRNGLPTFMASTGQQPKPISTQAVNVLLAQAVQQEGLQPFFTSNTNGFLYEYENTLFYRVSAGNFLDFGDLDIEDSANALEYNFNTETWIRVIEVNGERSRVSKHIFFNNQHLVTVENQKELYELTGAVYYNELRNPNQDNGQADDAYIAYPMRYELVTPQISEPDYSEFITDYVEIDFVFGEQSFYNYNAAFKNTVYLVTEDSDPDNPTYIEAEDSTDNNLILLEADGTNAPAIDEAHYNKWFKPHIELYYSNDGGVTFHTADLREFSQIGQYEFKMRWYELGASRNRCYKLICVAPCPIVVLGGVQLVRRASGGAN